MKKSIITAALIAALSAPVVYGQTTEQQEFCATFATVQRAVAEIRDHGKSKDVARAFYRKQLQKAGFDQELTRQLMISFDRTWSLGLSPDVTEITARATCLEGMRQ